MIKYRRASFDDICELLRWAADAGWNPGLEDADVFHAADNGGFFVAVEGQRPVAGISVIRQGNLVSGDNPFGFLGLYLCTPEFRGRGIGWKTWQHGMDYLHDCVVGLDGVVEQQDNYRKSGFEFAWRNVRYAGTPAIKAMITPAATDDALLSRGFAAHDRDSVVAYDASISGVERRQYLTSLMSPTNHRNTQVLMQRSADGAEQLCGYGTIRRCVEGFKIGPLVARNSEHAMMLMRHLCDSMAADSVMIDVPEPNTTAADLAHHIGLVPVFETARMYRGHRPEVNLSDQYGMATLELG